MARLSRSPPQASVRALVAADADIVDVLVELLLVDDRADLRALLHGIVDVQALHALHQRADEAVVDALRHDEARGRRAALAGGEEGAVGGAFHRRLQIGVVEDDQRVLAAHLQLEAAEVLGGGFRHALAGRHRAGEGDGVDVRAVEDRLADHRAGAHDEVEDALGQAGAVEDVGERPAAARHQVGRLEHYRVAVDDCRRDLPGGNGDREVPRRDQADDAERLALHHHLDAGPDAGDELAVQPQRLAGEEGKDLAGADYLAGRFHQRLALLAGQQSSKLLLAADDLVGGFFENIVALLDAGARPRRKGRLRRGDSPLSIGLGAPRVEADHLLRIGRVDVLVGVFALHPFAGDQIAVQLGHGQPFRDGLVTAPSPI